LRVSKVAALHGNLRLIVLHSSVLPSISHYSLLFFNAFKKEGIILASRVPLLIIATDVVGFDASVVKTIIYFLNRLLLSLNDLIKVYNLYPRFSHFLLLIVDIFLAFYAKLEKLIIL
jgi:hypothetical protein